MQKKPMLIAGALLITILGAAVYVGLSTSDNQARQDMAALPISDAAIPPAPMGSTDAVPPTTSPAPAAGSYADYSDEALATASGTRLLFFHAPWCPQCRALEADIKQDGVPAGVTILKVDYDSNQGLRQKYGVTIQTTVVLVDADGKLVKRYVAYESPTLDAVKANLL